MRTQTHNNNKNVFNVLWGTDFRWVKKPKLEHKWFFPGNKHAWLLICCNFLLSLVKTAITYLFHIPPSTDAPQSVHVPSTKRAVCTRGRACLRWAARQGRFAPRTLHCWQRLLATDAALPPSQDNGVPGLTSSHVPCWRPALPAAARQSAGLASRGSGRMDKSWDGHTSSGWSPVGQTFDIAFAVLSFVVVWGLWAVSGAAESNIVWSKKGFEGNEITGWLKAM